MSNSNSFESSSTTIPSEYALDECYERFKNQLQLHINEKLISSNLRKLCEQWLKVFDGATNESQKLSRNCLMVLMLEQMETYYTIAWPFTDIANLKLDIDELLTNYANENELHMVVPGNVNMDEPILPPAAAIAKDSQRVEENKKENLENKEERMGGGYNKATNFLNQQIITDKHKEIQDENALLKAKLERIRSEYVHAQAKAQLLRDKIEKCKLLAEEFNEKRKENLIKENIRSGLKMYLKQLYSTDNANVEAALPMRVFENCFQHLLGQHPDEDPLFYEAIRVSDIEFDVILNSYFHREYKTRLETLILTATRKLEKAKRNLHTKYSERLNFNSWTSDLQIKLIRMKCYSALRNIFIGMRNGDTHRMQVMMNMLEQNCRDIFEETGC